MLPNRAADGAGEDAGLQRRDADLPVELGAPRLLVGLDEQPQAASADLVARGGALAAAPLWQVVRNPATFVQPVTVERVLELELVPRLTDLVLRLTP
ncbi:MAG TPA: hypothetical protein VE568_02930 [Rubrobacter sp.]|nr:hypothetical protein [Rubrobacter sp.]